MKRYLHSSEEEFLADKLMDLANLSAVVLIFEQLVRNKMNFISIGFGIIFYLIIIISSKYIFKRRKK